MKLYMGKMRLSFGIVDIVIGLIFISMVLQSDGGVSANSRVMGMAWFLSVTGIISIIGMRRKTITIISLIFYVLGIVYNIVMSLQNVAHLFIVLLSIAFAVCTFISLIMKQDFK